MLNKLTERLADCKYCFKENIKTFSKTYVTGVIGVFFYISYYIITLLETFNRMDNNFQSTNFVSLRIFYTTIESFLKYICCKTENIITWYSESPLINEFK